MSKKLLENVVNNPEKVIRLCLFDAERHKAKDAFRLWETTEPKSVRGMRNAYKEVLNTFDKDLSVEIIEKIRDKLLPEEHDTSLVQKKWFKYGNVTKENINSAPSSGIRNFSIPHLTPEQEEQIKQNSQSLKERFKLGTEPYTCWNRDPKEEESRFYANLSGDDLQTVYKGLINDYNNIKQKTQDNIINLVTELERIHPYNDFNCRTFCALILNRELTKNSFQPVIMENHNFFDNQTLDELRESVAQGQANFKYLYSSEKNIVHENDPDNKVWKENCNTYEVEQEFNNLINGKEAGYFEEKVKKTKDPFIKDPFAGFSFDNLPENKESIEDKKLFLGVGDWQGENFKKETENVYPSIPQKTLAQNTQQVSDSKEQKYTSPPISGNSTQQRGETARKTISELTEYSKARYDSWAEKFDRDMAQIKQKYTSSPIDGDSIEQRMQNISNNPEFKVVSSSLRGKFHFEGEMKEGEKPSVQPKQTQAYTKSPTPKRL